MLNIQKVRKIRKARLGLSFNLPPMDFQLDTSQFNTPYVFPKLNQPGTTTSSFDWNSAIPYVNQILANIGDPNLSKMGMLGQSIYSTAFQLKNLKGLTGTNRVAGAAGTVADTGRALLFGGVHDNDSSTTNSINQGYDTISSSLMAFAPIGTIGGGAMKVGGFVSDGLHTLGAGTDQMTTTDKILDSTPGTLMTLGLNGFLGKRTHNIQQNAETINQVGSSYAGTVSNIDEAVSKANKKYGAFSSGSRRSANRFIDKTRHQQNQMANIANEAKDLQIMGSQANTTQLNYENQLNGGYDPRYLAVAKQGIKLTGNIDLTTKEIKWEPQIVLPKSKYQLGGNLGWKPVIKVHWTPLIQFKSGGKVESQKNVIPEGNLHARLHHMNNDSNITKKGIPVIDNEGEQQAEIELNEIIFTLEVTQKLEKLYTKYYSEKSKKDKDDIAIEAGKILVEEILFNTEDRTGLINTLKNGGKLDGIK